MAAKGNVSAVVNTSVPSRQLRPAAQTGVTPPLQEAPAPTAGPYGKPDGTQFTLSASAWQQSTEAKFELTQPRIVDITEFAITRNIIPNRMHSFVKATFNVIRDKQIMPALALKGVLACCTDPPRSPPAAGRAYGIDYIRIAVPKKLVDAVASKIRTLGIKLDEPPIAKSQESEGLVVFNTKVSGAAMGFVAKGPDGALQLNVRDMTGPLTKGSDLMCQAVLRVETAFKSQGKWKEGIHSLNLVPEILAVTSFSSDERLAPSGAGSGDSKVKAAYDADAEIEAETLEFYFGENMPAASA